MRQGNKRMLQTVRSDYGRNKRAVGDDKIIRVRESEIRNFFTMIALEGVLILVLIAGWLTTVAILTTNLPEPEVITVVEEVEVPVEVEKIVYLEKEVPTDVAEVMMPEAEFTNEEIDLMARVVMSEASISDIDVKFAIATTLVNRVRSDVFPDSVAEVVNQPNAYSTQENGEPNEDCYKAVKWAIESQIFPTDMYYFRTDHYHDFGKPLMHLGNTYFSTEGNK